MALIVEDGSIVLGADSYVTLADARAYLLLFGYSLDADDLTAEASLRLGFNYVNSFEDKYSGELVSGSQTGSFPRNGLTVNGFPFDNDKIPQQVKDAQSLAAYEEFSSTGALFPNTTRQTVVSEEVVGAVKVAYADNGGDSSKVYFTQIDAILKTLFDSFSGSHRVFRV